MYVSREKLPDKHLLKSAYLFPQLILKTHHYFFLCKSLQASQEFPFQISIRFSSLFPWGTRRFSPHPNNLVIFNHIHHVRNTFINHIRLFTDNFFPGVALPIFLLKILQFTANYPKLHRYQIQTRIVFNNAKISSIEPSQLLFVFCLFFFFCLGKSIVLQ